MARSYEAAPPAFDPETLADWAEATIIIEQRQQIQLSRLRSRLSLFTEEDGANQLDSDLEDMLGEIARRSRAAPAGYPFSTTGSEIIAREDSDDTIYEFLLWLSFSEPFRERRGWVETEQLFNAVVKTALESYLDAPGGAVRFARPPRDGRPNSFPEAVKWLSDLLRVRVGGTVPDAARNDGGADVVAWRALPDGRAGHPVVFCQATVRRDKWWEKGSDIKEDQWKDWINLRRDPVKALAIPFAVASSSRWDEARYGVDLILDRSRLCELVSGRDVTDTDEISEWTASERELVALA